MKITTRFTTILFQVLPASLALAAGGDWPQWGGPNRDGKSPETGLLKEWPQEGPPLAWKTTGLGAGFSSVAMVGQRIYTQGDVDGASVVLALNRADGKSIWASKLGKAGAPGWGGFTGPRGTPTVDGDLVFAVGQFGELACYNAKDGQEIWRKDYAKDFGANRPEWGFSGSPLVDGEMVLVAPGGEGGDVVALNKKTGAVIWRSAEMKDTVHYTSLAIQEIGGIRQCLLLGETSLAGITVKDGKMLWRTPRKGATAVIPDPIYSDGYIYTTSGYGAGCNLFKITAQDGRFSLEEVYKNKTIENHHGGVVKVGNYIYGYSEKGGWTCQEMLTGKVMWQESQKLRKGSIFYADGKLILREEDNKGSRKGRIVLIEATPSGYQEKGSFNQPDRSKDHAWPHPVVTGGMLYIRDGDVLLCYDLKAK